LKKYLQKHNSYRTLLFRVLFVCFSQPILLKLINKILLNSVNQCYQVT